MAFIPDAHPRGWLRLLEAHVRQGFARRQASSQGHR